MSKDLSMVFYIMSFQLFFKPSCSHLEGITSRDFLSTTQPETRLGPDYSNERFTAHDSLYFNSHETTFASIHANETNSSDETVTKSSLRICPSIDVRNSVANLAKLRGCKVVEGSVQIVLIDHANETDYDEYSFPELREITHYLLFYRVTGLRSVGQLFPSLSLIRGNYVFEDYALIIHEMFQLQEVGLHSLTEIARGAVRIEKNPSLCFLDTVNWDLIARWDSVKNYFSSNKRSADCPGRAVCRDASCPQGLCWSAAHCQMHMINGTYTECDKECLGGCSGPGPYNCYSCRKYLTIEGECVSKCTNKTYLHLNQRCVTKEYCLSLGHRKEVTKPITFVVFNGTCIQDCPPGYDFTQDKKSCEKCKKGKCRKVCQGQNIYDIASAQNLKGCTFINGTLEITIKHGKNKIIAEELEESLKTVEEIGGYLKIVRCFPMVNLKFFRNLEIIHGAELENDKSSLIILDNQNLQELWDIKPNFKILKGRMFFHYNPKLCFDIIEHLIEVTGQTNISNYEVAQDSNGDKFACNTTAVKVEFPRITSTLVLINISFPNRTKFQPNLQRYVLYHTEAESRNMTVFDETDECDDVSWKTRDILVEKGNLASSIQPNLKPYTEYAFYVKTYTVHSIGGQSPIYYIRTLPSRPSDIAITLSYSNSSSEIVIEWEPPSHPNGIITEYIVSGFWQRDNQNNKLNGRNYCQNPLEEDKVDQLHPELFTRVYNETKKCCQENKIMYNLKGKFKKLCDSLKLYQIPLENEEHRIDCNRYSYNYIDSDKEAILENGGSKRFTKRDSNSKQFLDKTNKIKGSQNNMQYYETYFGTANNDTTMYVIKNLKPFAMYTILIRACRQKMKGEEENDYNKRCSKSEITTVRTLKDLQADIIESDEVHHEIIEGWSVEAIEIKWPVPRMQNGIVLAFEIEYRRSDLEYATGNIECLTYQEFVNNSNKYKLQGLSPGTYSYRIRAMSLAGLGPFTKVSTFQINIISSKTYHYLLAIMIISVVSISVLSVLVLGVLYVLQQRRKNRFDLDNLIASACTDQLTPPPYIEDSWEIPRENVEIINELGQGTFGKVYEGILLPMKMACAVKTSTSSSLSDPTTLLKETMVMKKASGVHHMVQLLGVVSRGGPPLVVMELMALGDLKSYLRSCREQPPDNPRVLLMAAQIADAMFFMETNRFVHRDLAARNCMVDKTLTVKVGDFGLTRDIYSSDYYQKNSNVLLPVRWMSPESLRDGVFTSQSDVWSYGVVIWEIVTLAELPYRGSTNEQVVQLVMRGDSLSSPVFSPEPLKSMMAECWCQQPGRRPTFSQLVARLTPHTQETFNWSQPSRKRKGSEEAKVLRRPRC